MSYGALSIVLHAHLPYVRHPEYPEFLEEDWLYEAITETYLPLLEVFDRCVDDGVPFRITLTLTPPLVGMLRDELLVSRYAKRLDLLCELCDKEVHRTRADAQFGPLAWHYRERLYHLRRLFHDRYRRDLVSAFKRLQDGGACTRRCTRRAAWPRSRGTRKARCRSGAPSTAIPATRSTASSTGTSAGTSITSTSCPTSRRLATGRTPGSSTTGSRAKCRSE